MYYDSRCLFVNVDVLRVTGKGLPQYCILMSLKASADSKMVYWIGVASPVSCRVVCGLLCASV